MYEYPVCNINSLKLTFINYIIIISWKIKINKIIKAQLRNFLKILKKFKITQFFSHVPINNYYTIWIELLKDPFCHMQQ